MRTAAIVAARAAARAPRRSALAAALAASAFGATACAPRAGTGETAPVATTTTTTTATSTTRRVTRAPFGRLPDGRTPELFTMSNARGITMTATNYGAIIVALRTPDRAGRLADITLGYDSLGGYLKETPYFGAVVGRFGNRIARGRFTLDGQTYTLATNNGLNHLHGGTRGFDKVLWDAEPFSTDTSVGVVLRYTSPDMEEGYPGTLRAQVTYTLTDRDVLAVDYRATTDKATPVNLTQHTYWNLTGDARRDALDHRLLINASAFTPVDSTLIPTGELRPVAGTPFDFRTATAVGARIGASDTQLKYGGGYDHNWVLDRSGVAPGALALAARVEEPESGRTLEIRTTEPGIQFYSGNFLDGTIVGKGGVAYRHRWTLVLETQHFPDSPNQPTFPSTILRPGQTYESRTTFAFGVMR
jgi:aldose 1-epimerase